MLPTRSVDEPFLKSIAHGLTRYKYGCAWQSIYLSNACVPGLADSAGVRYPGMRGEKGLMCGLPPAPAGSVNKKPSRRVTYEISQSIICRSNISVHAGCSCFGRALQQEFCGTFRFKFCLSGLKDTADRESLLLQKKWFSSFS